MVFYHSFIKPSITTIIYVIDNSNKSYIHSKVVSSFLNGKQGDINAKELCISTGKVSAIIKEWKKRIDAPDIDELRDLAVIIRKSGMTIEQCAMGHRIICILKNLGISFDEKENDINSKDDQNYDNFFSFIKDIYLNCKDFKIAPSVVFPWIKDLFLCYSILNNNCHSSLSINSEFKGHNAIYDNVDSNTYANQLNINQLYDNNENGDLDFEKENKGLLETNSKEKEQSVIQVHDEGL